LAAYEFNAPRLFVEAPLHAGGRVPLDRAQANYLLNVLRLKTGGRVLVFNGQDGEWAAEVEAEGRKSADLVARERIREQTPVPELLYLFAPLKHARLDYMVQKAVEMGAGALQPVFTRRTQSQRVNLERMRANVIEATEQCGILSVPTILDEADLPAALRALEADRLLVFCDEDAPVANPVEALKAAAATLPATLGNKPPKLAVIVGPEGGFTDEERVLVAGHRPGCRVSLGPRILRADTAAVAALAVVQAALGDWR
jgi:16S rRNA (uracil1498-N3)-methyltransferase